MKTIQLTNGGSVQVDDKDYNFLSKFNWRRARGGYASANIYMHSLIVGKVDGKIIDHKDRNKDNNRRVNLRHATRSENAMNAPMRKNKFGYKGVAFDPRPKATNKYRAVLGIHKKSSKNLGYFPTPHLAALAYDFWTTHLFGEFAGTNFKVVSYGP